MASPRRRGSCRSRTAAVPTSAPVRTISDIVNTVSVSLDGSCDVVTPNARLAISGQLACGMSPSPGPPRCACASTMPGMIVLPVASMRVAPAGIVTRPVRTHRHDAVATDDDGAVVDHVGASCAGHGDDARTDQGDLAGRHVARLREADVHAGGFWRRRNVLSAFDEGERLREVARVQLRTERPVDATAVGRPVQREAGVARHLRDRVRRTARRDGGRTSRGRKRHHVGAEAFLEGHPLVVGRRHDLDRVLGLDVDDLVAAVEGHAAQHGLIAAAIAEEDARAIAVEERLLAVIGDLLRRVRPQWAR